MYDFIPMHPIKPKRSTIANIIMRAVQRHHIELAMTKKEIEETIRDMDYDFLVELGFYALADVDAQIFKEKLEAQNIK